MKNLEAIDEIIERFERSAEYQRAHGDLSGCQEFKQIAEWLKELKALKAEPCEDAISREAVNNLVDELARAISDERCHISRGRSSGEIMQDIIDLPSVTPKQKQESVLDKIRAEIEKIAKPNEVGGRGYKKSIRYGLCIALEIIDKYKAESEDEE